MHLETDISAANYLYFEKHNYKDRFRMSFNIVMFFQPVYCYRYSFLILVQIFLYVIQMIQQVMLSFLFICISTKVSIVKKELALMFLRGKAAAVESESIRILAKKCNIIRLSNLKAFGQEIAIIFQKIF